VNFRLTPLAAAQRIRNLIFGGVRAKAMWELKIKNGRKTPDEIGRQIQAYAICCGISPTGSNSTKGATSQNS